MAEGRSLDAIVRSAADAIVMADSGGRIIGWNGAATRMFGHDEAEIVGRPLWVLIPERFREAHKAGLSRVVETGETRIIGKTVEVFGLHQEGHEFPIELSLATWMEGEDRLFVVLQLGHQRPGPELLLGLVQLQSRATV